jgi:hypothetical protein
MTREGRWDGYREDVLFFNTTGPCVPGKHYMLPPQSRLPEVRDLIEQERYIVMHAPRQTGKTTTLNAYARDLTASGKYAAVVFSCERTRWMDSRGVGAVEDMILFTITRRAVAQGLTKDLLPPDPWPSAPTGARIEAGFQAWAEKCPRPLVLFADEFDSIQGDAMLSILSQIRDGHNARPVPFPASVVLCGLRDVRDYRVASGASPEPRRPNSPFNIAVSMRLGDFTHDEVAALYAQHTAETSQEFTAEAIDIACEYTQGQPLLVNALAYEITWPMKIKPPQPVTAAHVKTAKERVILARAVHLDNLISRLEEPRVERVLQPLLLGDQLPIADDAYDDDVAYVRDLGLIRQDDSAGLVRMANPIYKEVLIRALTARIQRSIRVEPRDFLLPDGRIDTAKLTDGFVSFWKLNGAIMTQGGAYNEYAAQLVFMAYLQRVVNGGGYVDREYGVSLGRTDILIRKPFTGPDGAPATQRAVYELKVRRPDRPDSMAGGLTQLDGYLDTLGLSQGTLIIFDRRADAPAPSLTREATSAGREITVLALPDRVRS